jgi:NADPH-dependent 2,4-dienoyl-CoA reductase/sulfur reductase-like enzyme/rhodanese-related sulfurtransferase
LFDATPDLSMSKKKYSDVVIVGGVAAGPKTAATLARRDKNLSITLYQKEELLSYGSCGLPYFASGDIDSFQQLIATSYGVVRSPEFFKNSKGFEAVAGAEVIKINRNEKTVSVRLLESGEEFEHEYKYLVLATGSTPTPPPFPVTASEKIRSFTRPSDAIAFRKMAQTGQVGKAVIIGGGFIGCELAETCGGLWGIETVLIERENQILPYALDYEMAVIAQRELARQDIELLTDTTVEKIDLDDDGNPVVYITGKESISCDYLFLCLGVRPNVSLASECGLEIGETGGIKVDENLRTSDSNIYSGGDCVESINQITKKAFYIPMGSLANRHGRVIAENIVGNQMSYPGSLGTFLIKLFNCNVGSSGISKQVAENFGLKADFVLGTFPDKPDYYPEGKTFKAMMVYEPDSHRVLGLQAVGLGDICRRVDSMSALLQHNATLESVLDFEHGYAPPYSEALDPLYHLAAMALAKIRGISFISPVDLSEMSQESIIWLDVREPSEIESEPWDICGKDNYFNIPLDELRNRIDELDKNRKIVIVCKRGPRSYQAAVILKQADFESVDIIGGGYEAAVL